jgi:hypothetical protein
MIEENNDRDTPFCDYIFQLASAKVCAVTKDSSTTSAPFLTTSTGSSESAAPNNSKGSKKLGVLPIVLIV